MIVLADAALALTGKGRRHADNDSLIVVNPARLCAIRAGSLSNAETWRGLSRTNQAEFILCIILMAQNKQKQSEGLVVTRG
jgi:hypothetical protein